MKYINDFLDYLKYEKNYSDETIKNYNIDITDYYEYIDKRHLSFKDISYNDARDYVRYLTEEKKESSSTVSRYISALRTFFNYLVKIEYLDKNVFLLIKLPKKGKHLPKFFYYNEIENMLDSIDIDTSLGYRNMLLLDLLYATGVRVSELVNIKISDIDINGKKIKIMGKGSKERYVYFDDNTKDMINIYIKKWRRELDKKNSKYLLLNNNGEGLSTRGVRYILDGIIKKTSIDKNISPHMLRHSFATSLLNEGCDIMSVQELLGHSSLSATGIYTHVTNDRLKEVFMKTMPRAKKK